MDVRKTLILRFILICLFQKEDIDKAIEAAEKAFDYDSLWRQMEPVARANLMRKLADLLRRDVDYLSVRYQLSCFTLTSNQCLEIGNIK